MADTSTRVRAEVGVKTWVHATTYVVNETFRVWLIILQQRGLSNAPLLKQKDVIQNGLWTWISTHHLHKAILEVYQEGSNDAVESWDLIFKYANPQEDASSQDDVSDVWKTYLDEMSEFMRRLDALPDNAIYRVVVSLTGNIEGQPPPEVEGWGTTALKNRDHLQSHTMGEKVINARDLIQVDMEYWGKMGGGEEVS